MPYFEYKNKKGQIERKKYSEIDKWRPYTHYHFKFIDNSFGYDFEKSRASEIMLYHYEQLVEKIKNNKEIFLVGNEFDVEFLENLDYVATSLSHFKIRNIENLKNLCSIFKGTTLYVTTNWLYHLEEEIENGDFKRDYKFLLKILYEYANKVYILTISDDIEVVVEWHTNGRVDRQGIINVIEEKIKKSATELDGINFDVNTKSDNI